MPIEHIAQPELLRITDALRLRKYDGEHAFALPWYLDEETVWLVDGVRRRYTPELLEKMYAYQDAHGELYFIETQEEGGWRPIGDVCLSPDDVAIVIGEKADRSRGVGRAVISAMIGRARDLGWERVLVRDIYDFNTGSRRLFTSLGFQEGERTGKGRRYLLYLSE